MAPTRSVSTSSFPKDLPWITRLKHCRNERIPMNGEAILLVLATSDTYPQLGQGTVYCYLHYPLGSENSYVYARQDDQVVP